MLKIFLLVGVILVGLGSAVNAQEVTITSPDGASSLTGEIVEIREDTIDLRTSVGVLTLDYSQVNCEGEGCPPKASVAQIVNVHAPQAVIDTVLEPLASTYALDMEGRFRTDVDGTVVVTKDDDTVVTLATTISRSDEAVQSLLSGNADLIITDRRMTNAEIEAFITAGLGDLTLAEFETIYAQDAVVFIVNEDNPVKNLPLEQAEGIFSGRISNWSQIGGPNLAIRAIAPSAESDLSKYFQQVVLDQNFSEYADDVERLDEGILIDEAVSSDPAAIGFVSTVDVGLSNQLMLSSSCGIRVGPQSFRIRAEDYPLSRRLYAYHTNRPLPSHGENILSLLRSKDGQSIVQASGYTSFTTETAGLERFGSQLAYSLGSPSQIPELTNLREFASEVLDAQRLSNTFRFTSGSSQLDNKSRDEAARLAELLDQPAYSGAEIKLVGFTDSIGRNDVNTLLSQRRAGQVLDEIVAAGGGQIDVNQFKILGFGAAYPSACNTDDVGRQTNRRVEVWIQ